ncbi:MAG: hypothetical protein QOD06_2333, partial [Candidatus Binatota bacterium]|nr:hypothetical protein [Candidatus Binatota bacterium]
AAPADGGWSRWRYYWEEWLLRDRKAKFRRFVGAIAAGEERPFYFLHTVLPHRPYIYLPSGTSYRGERDGLDVPERWPDEPLAPVLAYQRHLLQVGFVDRLLGELVAQLRAAGVYDRALLVVVADHGVSFRPGEVTRNVTDTNFDEQERVPLFVKLPGQRAGRVSDRNVELVDVLPTIAQTLGIAVPWRMDGHSMLDKQAPERPNKTVLAWSSGTMETFPGRFAPAAMRRAIAYRLSLFGSGGSPAELFGIGEARSLLGRSLADSGVTGAVPIAVELDRGPRGKIDALPCIRGKLLDAADARGALAVEIGGIVRAVTLPFTAKNGAIRLAAPIAESPSRAGAEVRVLRLPAELSPALSSPAPASPGDRAGADTDRHSRSRGRG